MRARSRWIALVAAASATSIAMALGAGAASAATRTVAAPHVTGHVTYRGTVNLSQLAAAAGSRASLAPPTTRRQGTPLLKRLSSQASAVAKANPNPPPDSLMNVTPSMGFVGLTAADSGQLNGFDVEPPDQGLCAHGSKVLESVNLALDVYTEAGQRLMSPVSLNAFFGLPPAASTINGHTFYGPFLSDPRCLYDPQTGRWFQTVLEISADPYTGALQGPAYELIAVSATSDPTGSYGLFEVPATMDGTNGMPSGAHCPCFGDQPRIGADANGFYISADEYPINGVYNSNGGFIWAMSKRALASAASSGGQGPVGFVGIWIGAITINGYPANAVQPAQTPEGAAYPSNREYFLSTPDFNGFATSGGKGASSVVQWTMLNTASLNKSSPSVTLQYTKVGSEPFTPPYNAPQKPGPHPLGQSLGDAVQPLSVNDDRMQQTEYLNGHLYSSLNTGVGSGASDRSGAAWFDINANQAKMAHQGYVAATNMASVMYPAIGLLSNGRGAMTFSVDGPNNYPSAAYVPFASGPTGSTIYIDGPGALPEDGFTCYAQFGFGPPCRWGDYSAASSDGAGHIVMGDEMIANVQRDPQANWDTFISTYTP